MQASEYIRAVCFCGVGAYSFMQFCMSVGTGRPVNTTQSDQQTIIERTAIDLRDVSFYGSC